jgi:hypothetical protein
LSEKIQDFSGVFEQRCCSNNFISYVIENRWADCNAEPQGKQEKQMKQKTEIEIELNETVAYSRRSERFETFCPNCKSLVEMAAPQVAAILTQTTEREIYRLVETNKIHFIETDRVLICLKSLTDLPKLPAASGR